MESERSIVLTEEQLNEIINTKIEDEIRRRFQINNNEEDDTQTIEDDGWISQAKARSAGEINIPESLQDIFNKDQMQNLYCKNSITKFLTKHPEPKGGYLKTQSVENSLSIPADAKKSDESLQDVQRNILNTIRPLITLYNC